MEPAREDWLATLDELIAGDAVAFARLADLIQGHLARLRAYDLRDSWQDLVQEVVVALIRARQRGSIREPRAFVSYVGTVTRNKLYDWMQARRRPGNADSSGEPEAAAESVEAAREQIERRGPDMLLDLERGLLRLAEKQRRVLASIYLEGHTYEETSKRLGMPLGTVNRLQREGLRALRGHMGVEN